MKKEKGIIYMQIGEYRRLFDRATATWIMRGVIDVIGYWPIEDNDGNRVAYYLEVSGPKWMVKLLDKLSDLVETMDRPRPEAIRVH